MTQQIINVGNVANDGQGTPLRTAFQYINSNFTELYSGAGSAEISNGTSNVIVSANGNITTSVNGTSNVMVISSTSVAITGDLSVSGNATLSGNILGDRIVNGTTELDIQVANGNANLTIGGTSNVVVWATTGQYITGLISATGNITGGNVTLDTSSGNVWAHDAVLGGVVSATGNVRGGNVNTAGLITATGNITGGNILTAGLISAGGTVTGTSHLGAVVSVTGNITGGNILTAGLISATGNVNVGNLINAGLTSVTGNITGGNILTAGIVKTTAKTYATLPTAANAGAGARSFITDGNTATFGSQVIAGGANAVPVWSNGTNWYVG